MRPQFSIKYLASLTAAFGAGWALVINDLRYDLQPFDVVIFCSLLLQFGLVILVTGPRRIGLLLLLVGLPGVLAWVYGMYRMATMHAP